MGDEETLSRDMQAGGRLNSVEQRRTRSGKVTTVSVLQAWIRCVPNVVLQVASGRLGRRLEAFAIHVVQPAVIDTPKSTVFRPSITQIRSTVRTMHVEETDPSLIVAEHDEILAEQPERNRRSSRRQLLAQNRGLPVLRRSFPHGVPGRV